MGTTSPLTSGAVSTTQYCHWPNPEPAQHSRVATEKRTVFIPPSYRPPGDPQPAIFGKMPVIRSGAATYCDPGTGCFTRDRPLNSNGDRFIDTNEQPGCQPSLSGFSRTVTKEKAIRTPAFNAGPDSLSSGRIVGGRRAAFAQSERAPGPTAHGTTSPNPTLEPLPGNDPFIRLRAMMDVVNRVCSETSSKRSSRFAASLSIRHDDISHFHGIRCSGPASF